MIVNTDKKHGEKMVTALVTPSLALDGTGNKVNVNTLCPRREPKPSRKVVEGSDESENSQADPNKDDKIEKN